MSVVYIALWNIGGFEMMSNQFLAAAANYSYVDEALYHNHSCGFPPDNSFHIFRAADDPNYPWPGMVFGLTVLALNAWCTDQVILVISTVQHVTLYIPFRILTALAVKKM